MLALVLLHDSRSAAGMGKIAWRHAAFLCRGNGESRFASRFEEGDLAMFGWLLSEL